MILKLALLLWGCASPAERCNVVSITSSRAGVGAVDCGLATVGEDDDAVHACVVAALREGEAFRGLVQESVASGLLVRGWVSDGEVVEIVLADFEGCDATTCKGSVVAIPCPGVTVEEVDGREQIACGWEEPPCGERLCGADPGCEG